MRRACSDIAGTILRHCVVRVWSTVCKASPVQLLRLHLALHVGGKGFAVIVGDVADVEASMGAGAQAAGGALVAQSVLPNPYPELYEQLQGDYPW